MNWGCFRAVDAARIKHPFNLFDLFYLDLINVSLISLYMYSYRPLYGKFFSFFFLSLSLHLHAAWIGLTHKLKKKQYCSLAQITCILLCKCKHLMAKFEQTIECNVPTLLPPHIMCLSWSNHNCSAALDNSQNLHSNRIKTIIKLPISIAWYRKTKTPLACRNCIIETSARPLFPQWSHHVYPQFLPGSHPNYQNATNMHHNHSNNPNLTRITNSPTTPTATTPTSTSTTPTNLSQTVHTNSNTTKSAQSAITHHSHNNNSNSNNHCHYPLHLANNNHHHHHHNHHYHHHQHQQQQQSQHPSQHRNHLHSVHANGGATVAAATNASATAVATQMRTRNHNNAHKRITINNNDYRFRTDSGIVLGTAQNMRQQIVRQPNH